MTSNLFEIIFQVPCKWMIKNFSGQKRDMLNAIVIRIITDCKKCCFVISFDISYKIFNLETFNFLLWMWMGLYGQLPIKEMMNCFLRLLFSHSSFSSLH